MKGKGSPRYIDYFGYMADHHDFPQKQTPIEKFYVKDLEQRQYPMLEGEVSAERTDFDSPEEAAKTVREFALSAGADLVGFTGLSGEMVFEGAKVEGDLAISLGLAMDRDAIETAPDPPAGVEALRAYWKLGDIVVKVARFIRSLGYPAQGHQVRTFLNDPPTVLHPAVGLKAGIGEIGRMGILVSREFGPRFRLGTVTTDLPLPDIGEKKFGLDEFCSSCTICMDNCRGNAIPREKTTVRGVRKYKLDAYACLPEFARYDGCGICIKVCPFNRK